MSRGLGEIQRFVLKQFADAEPRVWTRADSLAYLHAGQEPTPAEIEAMRRAFRTLAKRGLIETDDPTCPNPNPKYDYRLNPPRWYVAPHPNPKQSKQQRPRLAGRLPLNDEDKAIEAAARDLADTRFAEFMESLRAR